MKKSKTTLDLGELLDRLFARINYERRDPLSPLRLKTEGISELVRQCGNPHWCYPVIHVAGTKGKGSVTRLSASILRAHGVRTGTYTSPHLNRFNERIGIGGADIDDLALLKALRFVFDIVDQHDSENWCQQLSFFDIATTVAFVAFQQSGVAAASVEVGLGGRLDSTNVCQPSVCVITNISLDHTRQLGSSRESIAREKAGIIKPGIPVVLGRLEPEPLKAILEIAHRQQAPVFQLGIDFQAEISKLDGTGATLDWIDLRNGRHVLGQNLSIRMLGRHQVDNAVVALMAAQILSEVRGNDLISRNQNVGDVAGQMRLDPTKCHEALVTFQHAGRLEIVCRRPWTLLDVSHNAASTEALIETLQNQSTEWRDSRVKWLIVSISRDKDQRAILGKLIRHFDHLVFTQYQNNPRATPADELRAIASELCLQTGATCQLTIRTEPQAAWNFVNDSIQNSDSLVIAGSLFLVAELRDAFGA